MITQALCLSFMQELPVAVHNFTAGSGHTFKMALYTSSATLNSSTTVYSATDEISGTGYVAGGATMTSVTPVISNGKVVFDFADVTWTTSTFTARGALIYNSSASDKAVLVLDFGSDRTVSGGTFTVRMPDATSSDAIIRIA